MISDIGPRIECNLPNNIFLAVQMGELLQVSGKGAFLWQARKLSDTDHQSAILVSMTVSAEGMSKRICKHAVLIAANWTGLKTGNAETDMDTA